MDVTNCTFDCVFRIDLPTNAPLGADAESLIEHFKVICLVRMVWITSGLLSNVTTEAGGVALK